MGGLKILLTGANGFVGRNLLTHLLPNYAVLGLQRTSPEHPYCLQVDYNDPTRLEAIFQSFQPDVVIHLASNTSRTRAMHELPRFIDANLHLTNQLLLAGITLPQPPKFIFLSSAEVYGPQTGCLDESTQTNPVSPYGISKVYAEELLELYHRNYGIAVHVLRVFNAYGNGQDPGFFFADLMRAYRESKVFEMTGGEQKRDFIYIQDLVRAIEMFIYRPNLFECVNISSGIPISLAHVVEVFSEKVKGQLEVSKTLPYRANEIWEISGNNSTLNGLGFNLLFSLEQGIEAMLGHEKV